MKKEKINRSYLEYLYIENNFSLKDVAKFYDVCQTTVWKHLKKYNISKLKKYKYDTSVFEMFSPESCYWSGFIAADGNVYNGRLTILLNKKDVAHLEKFLRFVSTDKKIEYIIGGFLNTEYAVVRINSTKIVKDLKNNFNIIPNKSLILEPPKDMPENLIHHFIRGFMDGDGCISFSNNYPEISFTTGSENILIWIKNNIKKNNLVGNPKIIKRKNSNTFSLKFGGNQSKIILDWIYKESNVEILLDRKHNKFLSIGEK